jgi:GTP pyrophosphokinase
VRTRHLTLVPRAESDPAAGWLDSLGADFAKAGDGSLLADVLQWAAPQLAGRVHPSGAPAIAHALHTASILHGLKLDAECLAAALVAQIAVARDAVLAIHERFGASIAGLADGIARMELIESLGSRVTSVDESTAQMESLRKMLLAMAQDVRVVLVKLADHAQTLREAVKSDDARLRRESAKLALDIFAPLANRLGVWQLKWELEDMALRILEPDTYQRIAGMIDEKRGDRERYIENVMARLRTELARARIKAEVSGRPKHIYSIYNKMRGKGVAFDALYDVRAVRVLVGDVSDCYAVLGIVHSLWSPLAKEFDDYIAKPKSNNYRSLHTAVTGPEGKSLEVQSRTFDMHQHAELGVAAHWRYKEGGRGGSRRDAGYEEKIAWLRQIVAWKDEVADAGEFAAQFRSEMFADAIYVLTPQGRVIDLPKGATPIDFAYHVHTDLGHRCRGAKVDGVMVPLNTALKNGQQIEIAAVRNGGPSRDWLNPALGFLQSAGARSKVRQWFNRQNHEASILQGREFIDKELHRLGMTGVNLENLAQQFGFEKLDEFLADAGRGGVSARQLQTVLRTNDPPAALEAEPLVRSPRASPSGILVVGVDKLLTVPARCCKPAPPDAIIGFVSRGRGVTIHRRGCGNVRRLAAERLIEADWGASAGATFAVDIVVESRFRAGLLREITEILSRERINVTATSSAHRDEFARMLLTAEIGNLEQLNRALAMLRELPGITRASRR